MFRHLHKRFSEMKRYQEEEDWTVEDGLNGRIEEERDERTSATEKIGLNEGGVKQKKRRVHKTKETRAEDMEERKCERGIIAGISLEKRGGDRGGGGTREHDERKREI